MDLELKTLEGKQLLEQGRVQKSEEGEEERGEGDDDEEEKNKKIELREHRCPICCKLFFRAKITSALIEIKCRNCKKVTRIKSLGV